MPIGEWYAFPSFKNDQHGSRRRRMATVAAGHPKRDRRKQAQQRHEAKRARR